MTLNKFVFIVLLVRPEKIIIKNKIFGDYLCDNLLSSYKKMFNTCVKNEFKDNKIFENLFINGFTLILIYIYLTETFQERHHGQMFYAFFLYLAILEKHHKEVINESI